VVYVLTNHQKTNSNARNPAREAGSTIIKKQTTCNALKPAKWLKLDKHLVGDNTNKGCTRKDMSRPEISLQFVD
jgi:hypothetical protein